MCHQKGVNQHSAPVPKSQLSKIMRTISRTPRLVKERDAMILRLYLRGFFIEEIGEIFRLQKSRVSQILKVEAGNKNKPKLT